MHQQGRPSLKPPQSRIGSTKELAVLAQRGAKRTQLPERPPRPQQNAEQPHVAAEPAAPTMPRAEPTGSGGSSGGEFDGECVPGTVQKFMSSARKAGDNQHAARELSFPDHAGEFTVYRHARPPPPPPPPPGAPFPNHHPPLSHTFSPFEQDQMHDSDAEIRCLPGG